MRIQYVLSYMLYSANLTRGDITHGCRITQARTDLEPFLLSVPRALHVLNFAVNFLCRSETHPAPGTITRGQPTPLPIRSTSCCGSEALHNSRHLHTKVSHKQHNYIYPKLRRSLLNSVSRLEQHSTTYGTFLGDSCN